MSFPSPEIIVEKAARAYPRYLAAWVRSNDEGFFPHRIRVQLTPDSGASKETIGACERLIARSKSQRGWGYTVHRERIRSQDFGNNLFPTSVTVDTCEDLLKLAHKSEEFQAIDRVVTVVREHFPALNEWLVKSVRSLAKFAEEIDGLVMVAQYFLDHPWPNCYARQLPLPIDTKFVERNRTVLRQWLDILLPDSAIDVNERKFARRFGLRDGEPHRGIRLLDPSLVSDLQLPFGELSLPLRTIADLNVNDLTVFVVENNLNLVTMPAFPRGLGIQGEGNSVTRLERVRWLSNNRVIYWGDLDVEGFQILSRLRNLFPHIESIMMDLATVDHHREFAVTGNNTARSAPTNLTISEEAAFDYCQKENLRLEQERVLQPYVDQSFQELCDLRVQ